jgi:hypothetical protein
MIGVQVGRAGAHWARDPDREQRLIMEQVLTRT